MKTNKVLTKDERKEIAMRNQENINDDDWEPTQEWSDMVNNDFDEMERDDENK